MSNLFPLGVVATIPAALACLRNKARPLSELLPSSGRTWILSAAYSG